MITNVDLATVEKIKKHIEKSIPIGQTGVDWEKAEWVGLLDKLTSNLKIAPASYKPASEEDIKHRYFTVICENCGWWGPSKFLQGGHPLADTGDFTDAVCPVCDGTDVVEKTI